MNCIYNRDVRRTKTQPYSATLRRRGSYLWIHNNKNESYQGYDIIEHVSQAIRSGRRRTHVHTIKRFTRPHGRRCERHPQIPARTVAISEYVEPSISPVSAALTYTT